MHQFKIGVMVDSFQVGFEKGLIKAREVGAQGIQIYAVDGEMDPSNLSHENIIDKNKKILDNGLEVSALCGDFGGYGFTREQDNGWRIEKSKRIVDLALQLQCHVVTTHIGCIPTDKSSERYATMQKACYEIGTYASQCGAKFAIETGPEKAVTLASFIEDTGSNGIGVNLDPANLVMVTDDDPVLAVTTLGRYIVHTHAKDGVMIRKTEPQIIYDFFAEDGIGAIRLEDYFKEVPLGQGKVDFDALLNALASVGYHGYLTIEREVGETPEEDIRMAVEFLKKKCLNDV